MQCSVVSYSGVSGVPCSDVPYFVVPDFPLHMMRLYIFPVCFMFRCAECSVVKCFTTYKCLVFLCVNSLFRCTSFRCTFFLCCWYSVHDLMYMCPFPLLLVPLNMSYLVPFFYLIGILCVDCECVCTGTIRSAFLMTEPAVASSDATNIACGVSRENDMYVINGRKWWSSGAMDPRCKVLHW